MTQGSETGQHISEIMQMYGILYFSRGWERGGGGGVSIGGGSLSLKEQHSSSDQVLDPSLKMSAEKSLKYKQNLEDMKN